MKTQLLGVVLISLLAACGKRIDQTPVQAAATSEPLAVRVAKAETRTVDRAIYVTGSLHPDETVNVSAEVAGRVVRIHYDFGHFVRKGDILAELDKHELSLQYERARAALAQALARLGLDPDQVDANPDSTPAIRQAKAQYEDALSKFQSAQRLVETGDISRERFVELEKVLIARQAALDAARDDLRTQLANIQALRAEVKLAEKRLNDATVRAPFDGAVSARLVSPGQYIKENTPILTLVKTSPLRLRLDIPETAAAAVSIGSPLSFVTDAVPGREFRAIVRELGPSLDAQSRSLSAEARLVDHVPQLRPGMFVQVRLVVQRDVEVVVVPKEAVSTVAGLSKLFTVSDGKAEEVRVTPGIEFGDWVEVPSGRVRPGDLVAVSHLNTLVDGAEVRIEGQTAPRS
jgi:RND family efflux transporter MFP subunit